MIHGKEIHDSFRTRLERTFSGEVHSVFERVVNFQDDQGSMYAFLADSLDRGPDALILDIGTLGPLGISPGDRVVGSLEGLDVGAHHIDVRQAKPYALGLPDYRTDALTLQANLSYAAERLMGMATDQPTPFLGLMDRMVEERRLHLKEALRKGDLVECARLGKKLLGLGQGLTPTGDDILLGLFCVILMRNSPLGGLDGFPQAVLEGGDRQTNDLSFWGLRRAAKGQVREKVSDFVRDMAQGKEIGDSLESLLGIGHSSGRDITTGILTGFELIATLEESKR